MRHIIEYMLALLLVFVFSGSGVVTWICVITSLVLVMSYWSVYLRNVKKGKIERESYQFDWRFLTSLVLIGVINGMNQVPLVNTIFLCTMTIGLIIYVIGCWMKKDKLIKLCKIGYKFFFDFYVVLYMIALIGKILAIELN